MSNVKQAAVMQAIKLLTASGANFQVEFEGQRWGEFKKSKAKRVRSKYPLGSLGLHVAPYLSNLAVGDVAVVPIAPFDETSIRGSVTSTCTQLWGKQSYKTCKNKNNIEILRIN